jgi:hypothetical protein
MDHWGKFNGAASDNIFVPVEKNASGSIVNIRNTTNEKSVESDEVIISESSKRYWKIEAEGKSPDKISDIEIGWLPHKLVFMNSQNPPFRMVFGNSSAEPAIFHVDKLIYEIERKQKREVNKSRVTIGKLAITRGGQAVSGAGGFFNKNTFLWIVLSVAVGFLFYMARSLYVQIQKN